MSSTYPSQWQAVSRQPRSSVARMSSTGRPRCSSASPRNARQRRRSASRRVAVARNAETSDALATEPLVTVVELTTAAERREAAVAPDPRGVLPFRGGESVALQRMRHYIWDADCLGSYFETRNGMLGADYSSKFAPWLAHGCLSPRQVAHECAQYEKKRVQNKSTYWMVFELIWRDYFRFYCQKHGRALFMEGDVFVRVRDPLRVFWVLQRRNHHAVQVLVRHKRRLVVAGNEVL